MLLIAVTACSRGLVMLSSQYWPLQYMCLPDVMLSALRLRFVFFFFAFGVLPMLVLYKYTDTIWGVDYVDTGQ